MRLARAFTGRDKVLKFEGGWHGGHDLGQLSGAPAEPPPFPEAVPDCDGIPRSARHDVLVAPFNDLETTAAIIERHHSELAAVIVEPLQRALTPEAARMGHERAKVYGELWSALLKLEQEETK
ncbi:MAG: aminotransferase class III-fold pyridoxal phosphate-dependent enzyme [Deltaproteobacteria bacterium]|nr:aminotransferase class III-fold pyridoxal phosphate-dependent enzyme [Deltaproteobacteria bacterium]